MSDQQPSPGQKAVENIRYYYRMHLNYTLSVKEAELLLKHIEMLEDEIKTLNNRGANI